MVKRRLPSLMLFCFISMADAEIPLILARMLWDFDLELQPDSQDWLSQKVYLVFDELSDLVLTV
jgi:hypothetical protein